MIELLNISNVNIVSANRRLIRAHGRMINNPDYAAFKKQLYFMTATCKPLTPPYAITIHVSCYCDADNVVKPVLDALQTKGVIDDDKNVVRLEIVKTPIQKGKPGSIIVWGKSC